jgi:hypothetical protein
MRFRYLRDPLFLVCVAAYAMNRFVIKRVCMGTFFHSYLNDLICIPFWVPILLWLMRRCRLRGDDLAPPGYEILAPLLLWTVIFELLLTRLGPFRGRAVADPLDVLAYTCGAVLAAIVWHFYYRVADRRQAS